MAMRSLSATAGGESPPVKVRLAAETRERVIELAGPERGALSEFIRSAIADAIERADRGPPGEGGG